MKKSSETSFGILFFFVFLLIGIWPVLEGLNVRIWSIILSISFLILGILNSKLLIPLNSIWIKIGELLIDENKKIYLCDFGWGSVNNNMDCGIGLWACKNIDKPGGYRNDSETLKRLKLI